MDSDAKLITDIYYSSGLSKDVFNRVYLNTLKKYFSKINTDNEDAILISIKLALRSRRDFYLPDGVTAEEVHSNKDVWTFVVFLSGLIIPSDVDVDLLLTKILDNNIVIWLKDKKVESTLHAIRDNHSLNKNVHTIRAIYGFKETIDSPDAIQPVNSKESLIEIEEPNKLTNKEVGSLFIHWMLKPDNTSVLIKDGYYLIKSPIAFITFGKIEKISWKSIQKGVFKLGYHQTNQVNGTPFHTVDGINMVKFDASIKDIQSL